MTDKLTLTITLTPDELETLTPVLQVMYMTRDGQRPIVPESEPVAPAPVVVAPAPVVVAPAPVAVAPAPVAPAPAGACVTFPDFVKRVAVAKIPNETLMHALHAEGVEGLALLPASVEKIPAIAARLGL